MKGTKLWVQAGSPLIHGRSRTARPFGREALLACVSAVAVVALAVGLAWYMPVGRESIEGTLSSVLSSSWPSYAGAAAASVITLWLARSVGSRRAWMIAAATGVAVGVAMYTAASVSVL